MIRTIRALNEPLRHPFIDAFICAAEGFAAYMLEDWPTANARFSEAVVGFRDRCVGATYELGTVRNMLGRTLAHQGRLSEELGAQVAPTLRDAVRRGDLFNVVNVRTTAKARSCRWRTTTGSSRRTRSTRPKPRFPKARISASTRVLVGGVGDARSLSR